MAGHIQCKISCSSSNISVIVDTAAKQILEKIAKGWSITVSQDASMLHLTPVSDPGTKRPGVSNFIARGEKPGVYELVRTARARPGEPEFPKFGVTMTEIIVGNLGNTFSIPLPERLTPAITRARSAPAKSAHIPSDVPFEVFVQKLREAKQLINNAVEHYGAEISLEEGKIGAIRFIKEI